MSSCVSCLTWLIAIPVLFFAAIALGPWLLALVPIVVAIAVVVAVSSSGGAEGSCRDD